MKIKELAVTVSFLAVLGGLGVGSLLLPDKDVSTSERRPLTQIQSYSEQKTAAEEKGEAYGMTDYFSFLEKYMLDQFPGRDAFRSVKSVFKQYVLFQKDNNGYYYVDGTLCKMDPDLSDPALTDAVNRLNKVYEKYFKDLGSKVYYALIPDKNYFTAESNGYLHYDYDKLFESVSGMLNENMTAIEIRDKLSIEDYYTTDPHWDQAKILPVADALLEAMGASKLASGYSWTTNKLSPYYGTYYGQAALPVGSDTMSYLTGAALDGVTVYNYETGETKGLYDTDNFQNKDPYDLFLDGATPLLQIKNPNQSNGKQLVIFRDSFGSSLTPLLVSEYAEILVVDIRYISSNFLGNMVKFQPGCDVLFLYSTSVLNSYGVFK